MPTSTPSSDLTIADLPEDVREEGMRLKAQYHALASEAGLLTEDGAMDLGRLGDISTVKSMNLVILRALAETAVALEALPRSGISLHGLQEHLVDLGLDTKLDLSIEDTVTAYTRSYAEGAYGFTLDSRNLRFDLSLLPRLKEGLESGALNGLVITAYPTLEQVSKMAASLGENPESLLDLPVTEYLVRHFEARGGHIYKRDERLASWRTLKSSRDDRPLHVHYAENGKNLQKTHDALPTQQTLRDVVGQATLTFAYTRQQIPVDTPLLQTATVGSAERITAQGDGLTFNRLMAAGVDMLTPVEWLALLAQTANPADWTTYPTPFGLEGADNNWEWLAGITPSRAANASSDSAGADLVWNDPSYSLALSRARSALRGAPGFQTRSAGAQRRRGLG